jgi:hypothetical protein
MGGQRGRLLHGLHLGTAGPDAVAGQAERHQQSGARPLHSLHLSRGRHRAPLRQFLLFRREYREILRSSGLLPAFVRVEYSAALGGFVAADAFWPVYVPVQSHIRLGDTVLVNMPDPYNPFFILDVELATEYVRSRSFEREGSRALCSWGVRERAAMGLCLENVPPPFQTRYMVPVSRRTVTTPAFARVRHLPNNYANDPRSPLGKVRVDELFAGVQDWWR